MKKIVELLKYLNQKLIELKGKTAKSTVRVDVFNTSFLQLLQADRNSAGI